MEATSKWFWDTFERGGAFDGMKMLAARRRAGFTQDEVGALMGVSASLVSNWERGKVVPSFD